MTVRISTYCGPLQVPLDKGTNYTRSWVQCAAPEVSSVVQEGADPIVDLSIMLLAPGTDITDPLFVDANAMDIPLLRVEAPSSETNSNTTTWLSTSTFTYRYSNHSCGCSLHNPSHSCDVCGKWKVCCMT